MRVRSLAVTAALLTFTSIGAAPALAQTAAELFDQNTVQEIRLSVNSRDLAKLRANTQLNTYYTADLSWKNVKVRNVGIRSRGQGSRNPTKPGLRVDIARYTTGQTFVGLSTIILDNIWHYNDSGTLTYILYALVPALLGTLCLYLALRGWRRLAKRK